MAIASINVAGQQYLVGLSTDTKPIATSLQGARFIETDTQKWFTLDGSNTWQKYTEPSALFDAAGNPISSQSGGVTSNMFIWQANTLSWVKALADASGNLLVSGGGGGGGTVTQGPTGTNAAAWWMQIGDTVRGPVAVKAASTAAVAADLALVVAVSPNNSVAVTGTFFQGTQPISGSVSVSNFPATQPVSGTVTANQGTANTAANAWPAKITDGTNVGAVKAASTAAVAADPAQVVAISPNNTVGATQSGTWNVGTVTTVTTVTTVAAVTAITNALPTGANTIGKVDLLGNAGAILDAVITAATAPANGVATLLVNQTTAPSLSAGQSVALQGDYQGSQFVKPYRRGQTIKQATTISATGATTIVTAQAAGIFADIATLVISVTPQATTASSFTATLSDGTTSYIFDLVAPVTTATPQQPFKLEFNPPLPATTAATAWTLNLSATNTVHVSVVAVLQKAS